MSVLKDNPRDVLVDAYGARFWKWPEGQLDGLTQFLTSPSFRMKLKEARSLDIALDVALPQLVDGDRLESRLLSTMGFSQATRKRDGFSPGLAVSLAAASLCLGLAVGALYGGDALGVAEFAGLSEDAWAEVTQFDTTEEDAG
jgi:hypothetical protein